MKLIPTLLPDRAHARTNRNRNRFPGWAAALLPPTFDTPPFLYRSLPLIEDILYRRLGGETNREIDFGFGSCVRARGLVVRWE